MDFLDQVLDKYKAWKNRRFVQGVINDRRAVLSSYGRDIYMSDIVNNCIDRIATEISKIEVRSVIEKPGEIRVQNDDLTRLLRNRPNPLQTTKDFLASCVWLQRKAMHCFIYPQWVAVKDASGNTRRKYTALIPLNPTSVELGQDDSGLTWLAKFTWQDGSSDILPYADLIHLKWRRGTNLKLGGGDDNCNIDSRDTYRAVETLDKMLQGIPLSIEASLKMNGIFTTRAKVDADQIRKARDEFEERIMTSKFGIAAVDVAGEFTPLAARQAVIPESTMKFVKDIIRNRYGVSTAILDGDYGDEQHAAFYEACIEDFIVELQQAMTSALFTAREQDVGHRIKCYYNKVEYYSTANKIQLATIARDTGLMTLNQIADMFGLEPFEGGDRRLQSLNYVNTELVDSYQVEGGKDSHENE